VPILVNGTTVESTPTSIDFVGSCIVGETSPFVTGAVTIEIPTPEERWIVASHSAAFSIDANADPTFYWYGDKICGWDGCQLNVGGSLIRERADPLASEYNNMGIPLPFPIAAGYTVRVCGTAWLQDYDGSPLFGTALGFFTCNSYNPATGEYGVTAITNGADTFTVTPTQEGVVCAFGLEWTASIALDSCGTFFLLGFNVSQNGISSVAKVSYTLSVEQNCLE
jgi:hypothetical protein